MRDGSKLQRGHHKKVTGKGLQVSFTFGYSWKVGNKNTFKAVKTQAHTPTPVVAQDGMRDLLEKSWKLLETSRVLREECQMLVKESQRLRNK